jgi:hypothetical protein
VSVVIPAYKAAGTIARAIESVLDQSEPAFEVLVIDDGSPDDLSAALKPYAGQIRLIRKPNGGAASARNTGIDAATGELIAFLDADDFWERDKLKHHVELYRQFPELGLTCSRYFEQEPQEERQVALNPTRLCPVNPTLARSASEGRKAWPKTPSLALRASVDHSKKSIHRPLPGLQCDQVLHLEGRQAFEFGCKVWTGTVVVPRRLLSEDRFVSGLEPAEDRHLWISLAMSAPVYYLSQPLATAVLEPDSLSRSSIETDCTQMLRVVHAYRNLLGEDGVKHWEAHVYRRLAGVHLAARRPRQAFHPALAYLKRQPMNLRGWWVLFKSGWLSLSAPRRGHSRILRQS